jgi:hypothetical protein
VDRKVGGGKFHYRTGKWEGKLSISIRSFDSYAYIFSLKSLDLLNIFCFHTKMQLFLKFTPAKVGFYVPTPWHLPCKIIGIGWLFSAFTLFLYVITSCLTDLGGCRIVLRLNSVLFRLSVLQGCSPSLQRPWPTGGTVGLFSVFTASLTDWGTVGLFHLFTLPFSDWVDCRIVLVQSIQDLWTRKIYLRNDDFYFICSKN